MDVIPKRTPTGIELAGLQSTINSFQCKTKKGDFFVFPSWLLHSVYPFKGKRITISVNLL